MYKTPVVVEIFYSSAWHDVTALGDVAANPSIAITRGRVDETQQFAPGKCTLTLLNEDARYSPRNPLSPLYGLIGRNTPIRVSVTGFGIRFTGEIESWPQEWDVRGKVAIVPITAYGITRRLGAGGANAPVKSAQRRYYDTVSPAPVAYWPLESGDQRAALSFPSGLKGGPDLEVGHSAAFDVPQPFSAAGGVTPGPPGAASATDTHAGGFLRGAIPAVAGATRARAEVSFLVDGIDDYTQGPTMVGFRNPLPATILTSDGLNMSYIICEFVQQGPSHTVDDPFYLDVTWSGGAGTGFGMDTDHPIVLHDNAWYIVQFDISSANSGADTAWSVRVRGTNGLDRTYSGTATGFPWAPPTMTVTNTISTGIDRQAHLAAWSGTAVPSADDSFAAFLGFAGETVAERLARLGDEDGIVTALVGDAGTVMGPQPVGTAMSIRQDCIDADGGLLVENRDDLGLTYIALDALYNQPAGATLSYTAKEVAPPLKPLEDTRYLANDVTVTTPGGQSATVTRETGPLNVQEPGDDPQGVGRYEKSVPLNVDTVAQADAAAGWFVHLGTWDEPRYPTVSVNLTGLHDAGKTALMGDIADLDVAGRLEVTNPPAWQGPDTISQLVQGYGEIVGTHRWTWTGNTSPAGPYDVKQLAATPPDDDDLDGWLLPDSLTLHTTVNATATSWSVDIDPLMDTASSEFPCRAFCDGEEIRITACSGASSPQTWTVVRSVNGISKGHTAGAAIDLADPLVLSR